MANACETCEEKKCYRCDKVMIPVPPVCTAWWNANSWSHYIRFHGVDKEPKTFKTQFDTWEATGRYNENGEMLYKIKK